MEACRAVAGATSSESPPSPRGFGGTAFATMEACLAVAGATSSESPPSPRGFGGTAFATMEACLAVAGGASEGWWGKKDSNLRSHKTADLQSAPFATRDTPPFNHIASPTAELAAVRPWMTLRP